jgi:methylenetetrahydrofolate dehydrogenase (NADP+)/methenyltetrahydrofolate cyclohydrolase
VLDQPGATGPELTATLQDLSADDAVHGVICQAPLPAGLSLSEVGGHIEPAKDADGASPVSLGRLAAGLPAFAPATAAAVLEILRREQTPLTGARAVVVGRSVVVGKPTALLLLAENATVTVCHSRTTDLAEICAGADVLVAAVGRAGFIGADFVRPGAVVIDVGTNPTPDGGLAGDVDAAAVAGRAGRLTPVPGGVGPVTTMLLLRHAVTAAEAAAGHDSR